MDEKTIEQYREEMMQMYRLRRGTGEPDERPAFPAPPADGMTGEGRIIVVVSSGMGNIPIAGAVVTVREAGVTDGEVLRAVTDESGKTDLLSLPAPASNYSLAPAEQRVAVFSLYDIEAKADNYVSNIIYNVPVFDGVVSIQTMKMLWIPAAGGMNETQTEDEGNPYRL